MFGISIVYFEPAIANCAKSSVYFKARNFRWNFCEKNVRKIEGINFREWKIFLKVSKINLRNKLSRTRNEDNF